MAERRQWPRYQIQWTFILQGTDQTGLPFEECGRLRNLSVRGALGNFRVGVSVGTQVEVFIRLPSAQALWINYRGEVLRVEPAPAGTNIAVRFDTAQPKFVDSYISDDRPG